MNGYPDHIIEKTIACTSYMVKKFSVYLHLPWLGTPSVGLENKIKASVEKCFLAVEHHVVFTSRPLLSAIK